MHSASGGLFWQWSTAEHLHSFSRPRCSKAALQCTHFLHKSCSNNQGLQWTSPLWPRYCRHKNLDPPRWESRVITGSLYSAWSRSEYSFSYSTCCWEFCLPRAVWHPGLFLPVLLLHKPPDPLWDTVLKSDQLLLGRTQFDVSIWPSLKSDRSHACATSTGLGAYNSQWNHMSHTTYSLVLASWNWLPSSIHWAKTHFELNALLIFLGIIINIQQIVTILFLCRSFYSS